MKILILLICLFILSSCDDNDKVYPYYEYSVKDFVPDSNKIKMSIWITNTVSATNLKLSTSDYEDPEDVIEQCEETAQNLFSVKTDGLIVWRSPNIYPEWKAKDNLTKKELYILDSLKNLK